MAEKTGWSEKEILSMPFFKILSYLHVYTVRNGIATDWTTASREAVDLARRKFNAFFEK
jgi:hypothetical protein